MLSSRSYTEHFSALKADLHGFTFWGKKKKNLTGNLNKKDQPEDKQREVLSRTREAASTKTPKAGRAWSGPQSERALAKTRPWKLLGNLDFILIENH